VSRGEYRTGRRKAVGAASTPPPAQIEQPPAPPRRPKQRSSWWKWIALAGVGAGGYYFVWPWLRNKFQKGPSPEEQALNSYIEDEVTKRTQEATRGQFLPVQLVTQPAFTAPTPQTQHHVHHMAQPSHPTHSMMHPYAPAPPQLSPIEREARDRGFSSVTDYENSVVLNARQVRDSGAAVTLAPHLAHLAPRIYGV